MGTRTPNLNLYAPAIGETGWGINVSGNFSTLDAVSSDINVLNPAYGADPTGTNDSAPAIQAAINAAAARAQAITAKVGGDAAAAERSVINVIVPDGAYLVNSQISVPARVNLHVDGILINNLGTTGSAPYTFAVVIHGGSCSKMQMWCAQGSGMQVGAAFADGDEHIGYVRLWDVGDQYSATYGNQIGLQFTGYDAEADSIEIDGGNVGIDINQASDVRINKILSYSSSLPLRISGGAEHIYISQIDVDTPQSGVAQIDSCDDVHIGMMTAFSNDKDSPSPAISGTAGVLIGYYDASSGVTNLYVGNLRMDNLGGGTTTPALMVCNVANSRIGVNINNAALGTGNAKPITVGVAYGTSQGGHGAAASLTIEGEVDVTTPFSGTSAGTLISNGGNTVLQGNVGIGTSSPARLLNIYGGSSDGAQMRLTGNNANMGIELVDGSNGGYYNWHIGAQNEVANALTITPSTAINGTTFTTPVVTMRSAGNVGIGTASPSSLLSVGSSSQFQVNGSGKVVEYNGEPTAGNGIASISGAADLAAQAAEVAETTLFSAPATGLYRISAYAKVTQAATTSSTLPGVEIGWTDGDGTAFSGYGVTAPQGGNTLYTMAQGSAVLWCEAGTAVTYSTSGYASSGATAMEFELHIRAEAL